MTLITLSLYSQSYINDYQSGSTIYQWDGNYLTDYQSGATLYQMNGDVPRIVLSYILGVKGIEMNYGSQSGSSGNSDTKSEQFGLAKGTVETGSLVAVKGSGGLYFYACVVSVNGDNVEVKDYIWKNTTVVTMKDLIAVSSEGTSFAEGDKIFAVWPGDGKFYDGTLGKIEEEEGAYVIWDDGSISCLVNYDRMIKR